MALEDMKIKEKDFIGKDVSSLPVHPSAEGMGAVELQAAFDRAVKEVIVPKFNALLEEMPHLTKLLASTELTSEDFLHYANDTNTGFTISALLELSRQHRASMENPHAVTKEQIGLGKVDNTADKDKPASDAVKNEIKLTSDGLQAQINGVQEDLRNKASLIESHQSDINNPHKVTKEQVGLGNVDNTADKDKPVSDATLAMLNNHIDNANQVLGDFTKETNQVLRNLQDNYLKPLDEQTKQNKTAIDTVTGRVDAVSVVADAAKAKSEDNGTAIDEHKGRTDNPHKVTKEQVGLGSVDNTSDLNKPVSTAVQTALDGLTQKVSNSDGSLQSHQSNYNNPHKVTAEQVGLGKVDNTSDMDKPVSTAVQKALNNLAQKISESGGTGGTGASNADVEALKTDLTEVKSSVEQNKNTGLANKTAIDALSTQHGKDVQTLTDRINAFGNIRERVSIFTRDLRNHQTDYENPHEVTAEQVGLGNISSRVDALERQLPRVMTKAAFDALTEKDASVVYILT